MSMTRTRCRWALEHFRDRSRVVVALSLNKAFSAAGGVVVLPTPELQSLVRRCGGPMIFSGPIQPPMLGAAVASAELHLKPEFAELQSGLRDRVRLTRALASDLGVGFAVDSDSPIFFVHVGLLEKMLRLVQALRRRGIYVCPSGFPAVPKDKAGARFTISLHNTEADIREMLKTLAEELDALGIEGPERRAPNARVAPKARPDSVPPPIGE
jgi:7-keto-8-aminopelargonate synthetase-like enzyme